MLKKPQTVALAAALVALVVVAAGTGAYLALRQNALDTVTVQDTAARLVSDLSQTDATRPRLGDAGLPRAGEGVDVVDGLNAVDATEQLVIEVAEPPAAAPEPARRVSAPPPAPPQPSTSPRQTDTPPPGRKPRTEPEAAERPVPTPSRRASRDLPEIDGWERIDSRWPTPDESVVGSEEGEDAGEIVLAIDPDSIDSPFSSGPPPPPLVLPIMEELTIAADSVVGLQIDTFVTTERAEIEDDVQARVTRDVLVESDVAVPAGTIVMGSVVLVEQGGKIKGASRLGVRFHTIVFDDGVEVPMVTETVYREGRSRGGQSAAKIGGAAVGGAILGAIFGGGRGAAIGGAAGAAGGTAAAVAGDPEPATLPAGSTITVRLSRPATVTIER